MILKRCYLTHNDCYSKPTLINGNPTGIVVHDTGAGNPWLKRYVQPREDTPNRDVILADLGVNTNGNDWNHSQSAGESSRYACVHAFIGKNAAGTIETYETLPYNYCCWGVGNGSKGSYNYNPTARIQFEICDDGYKDEAYFRSAMREAQEYCAYLCKKFGFDVLQITDHQGAYQDGYGGNHSDIRSWCKKFGITDAVGWFRAEVQKIINKEDEPMTPAEREEFEALKRTVASQGKKIDELEDRLYDVEKINVVYHWYSQLPAYARNVIEALHHDGIFSGSGPGDMNLPYQMMRMLVIEAHAGLYGEKYVDM